MGEKKEQTFSPFFLFVESHFLSQIFPDLRTIVWRFCCYFIFTFTFTFWSARIWLVLLMFHNNHHLFDRISILTFPTLPTSPALCTPGYPGHRQFVVKTIKIVTIVKIVNPGNQDWVFHLLSSDWWLVLSYLIIPTTLITILIVISTTIMHWITIWTGLHIVFDFSNDHDDPSHQGHVVPGQVPPSALPCLGFSSPPSNPLLVELCGDLCKLKKITTCEGEWALSNHSSRWSSHKQTKGKLTKQRRANILIICLKSKGNSLTQSVTMSPIELFWTAKYVRILKVIMCKSGRSVRYISRSVRLDK